MYFFRSYDLYCGMSPCIGRLELFCSVEQLDTIEKALLSAGIDMKSNLIFDANGKESTTWCSFVQSRQSSN